MTAGNGPALAAAVEAAVAAARAGAPAGAALIAIGWSTVDLDRAERAFGGDFVDAPPDAWLGARCRVVRDRFEVALVVVEPVTEGRLAAALARHDEGPAAVWYEAPPATVVATRGASPGPFGPEVPLRTTATDPVVRFLVRTRTGTMPA